ncbi:alanyl-tRNA editing protein [Haloarchaeobius amylolyticus]|uniref:alanyl-tRNA editing protein n=1 Tax=Haloarchaeobius amylolyticus TaxID=1198296 RepID=UPI0022710D36|nr:alanyl-tRNA editing protein [Haloarchaeobius amylolyticus]
MTEPLHLDDSSIRQFEATVERTLDDRVVLDRTAFYPTGGGQPHDTGTLAADGETWAVTDVQKKDTIYHTVADTPPEAGTTVTGELDWDRRFAHMRYHTAQHLLSALLLEEFDAATTGNQVYADRARLDCAYDRFDEADLADIETRLNELVDDDREVTWYELDREVAEERLDTQRTRIDLLPDSITELRIVEIAGETPADEPFDRTACAGTHVPTTGDIGTVTVTGRETRGSEEERIYFELSD